MPSLIKEVKIGTKQDNQNILNQLPTMNTTKGCIDDDITSA